MLESGQNSGARRWLTFSFPTPGRTKLASRPWSPRSRPKAGPSGGIPEITPGEEFDGMISRELEAARSLVVVWTQQSVDSRWVRGEARDAADRGVLVPVRMDGAKLPIDFRAVHTTDLDGWNNDRGERGLQGSAQGAGSEARRAEEGCGRGSRSRGETGSHDLRAAVRQHERRPGAGILLRRHHRRHHHRPRQDLGAVDRLAQPGVLVQGLQGRRLATSAGRRMRRTC